MIFFQILSKTRIEIDAKIYYLFEAGKFKKKNDLRKLESFFDGYCEVYQVKQIDCISFHGFWRPSSKMAARFEYIR